MGQNTVSFELQYRPRTFGSMVGQVVPVRILRNSILCERARSLYLFRGQFGTGKTSLARVFASAILCLDLELDGEPCGECWNCRAIREGSLADYMEMDVALQRRLEDAKDLQAAIGFLPMAGNKRIFVLDEAHMFTPEAFAALLKTFEEPPEHVVFIMCSTEVEQIPDTIRSRAVELEFHAIPQGAIMRRLHRVCKERGLSFPDAFLKLVALRANGSLRDALKLLEQLDMFGPESFGEALSLIGVTPRKLIKVVAKAILAGDKGALFDVVPRILEAVSMSEFFGDLAEFVIGALARSTDRELTKRLLRVVAILERPIYLQASIGIPVRLCEMATIFEGWHKVERPKLEEVRGKVEALEGQDVLADILEV